MFMPIFIIIHHLEMDISNCGLNNFGTTLVVLMLSTSTQLVHTGTETLGYFDMLILCKFILQMFTKIRSHKHKAIIQTS